MIDYTFIIIIFLGGALLTFAIRYNNKNSHAGYGVVGWTIFIIIMYLYIFAMSSPSRDREEQKKKRYDDSVKIEILKLEKK